MGKDQIKKQILHLRQEIEQHNYRYHVLDDPLVSDAEYDQLFRRLLELEKEHPEFAAPDSPTQRVGAPPLEKFAAGRHAARVLKISQIEQKYSREPK